MVKNLPAMQETSPLQALRVIESIERELANVRGYPAGGAVAALVAGLAASLAGAAADRSREEWDEAAGARAQAQALARRAGALVERDAAEYARAREALASRSEAGEVSQPEDAGRDWRLGEAIERAAAPPLALAATAADIAELAAQIASRGAADVKPDAAIAAELAAAAGRAAAGLVQVNLVVGGDREPASRAAAYADAAAAAAGLASETLR
jgi:formiminotetrahydrofolate cyclodeaminase